MLIATTAFSSRHPIAMGSTIKIDDFVGFVSSQSIDANRFLSRELFVFRFAIFYFDMN